MKTACILSIALWGAGCSDPGEQLSDSSAAVSLPWFVTICGEVWSTRNLDVAVYRNGDPIPQVTDPAAWLKLTRGACCWYNNDSATYHRYGRLYNWYAVNDPRGLAPQGWHVLTDTEWEAMETCLGEDSVGYRLRATGQWPGPPTELDNSSGFTGLPNGMRSGSGTFSHAGRSAVYWTSAEGSVSEAWCGRLIHYTSNKGVPAMVTGVGYMNKADGYAVRCVKDRTPVDPKMDRDTALAYQAAIADYIKAMRQRDGSFPDTVFIGRHAEFPHIVLPAVMERTSVRIVPQEEAEALKAGAHFTYLNVFGWFTGDKMEFLVVHFKQHLRHRPDGQDDRRLYYSRRAGEMEFALDSLRP